MVNGKYNNLVHVGGIYINNEIYFMVLDVSLLFFLYEYTLLYMEKNAYFFLINRLFVIKIMFNIFQKL